MRCYRPCKKAFTIVELLVVIAIIGVLMALLLPAVQAARESGRRTACMNNLYQLGMAVNRYDQDAGKVPSWLNELGASTNKVSWPVLLLPYIERNDLYEQWSTGGGTPVRINSFTCPTAPPETGNAGPLAYAGNCGDGTNVNTATTNSKYNGVMPFPGVKYSLSDISDGDGTSNTLLFAEKCKTAWQAYWGLRNWACKYYKPETDACSSLVDFCFQQNLPPLLKCNGDAESLLQPPAFGISDNLVVNLPDFGPSSQHSNGGVVAFCDGHTKFISSNLDGPVYAQLVTSRNSRVTLSSYSAALLNEGDY